MVPQHFFPFPGNEELSGFQNVIWDELPDGFASMADSDILISDTSAIRMDYALLYEKPVITLATEIIDAETFEMSDLPAECLDSPAEKICVPVEKEQIAHISDLVETTLECWKSQDMTAFREKNIYNFGTSGEVIADYLIEKSAKYQKKADEKTEVALSVV